MTASNTHTMHWHKSADRLLSDLEQGVDQGKIPASIYGNPDIHDLELRRVFGRAWVYLGHESEIPSEGDYVLRKIGEDDFIVVRDEDGNVNVLFDACRHRGVQICRADHGNTSHFRCPYHGWVYDTKGNLIGAPLWKNALQGMPTEGNGLVKPAQVESYLGLIFATLDPSAPPLQEYLGGMKWYLDLIFGLNEHGIEILGEPQRFVIDADWKSGADNFSGDDYHLGTLHKSVWEVGAFPLSFEDNMQGYHIQAAPGHSLSFSMAMSEQEPGPRYFGFAPELVESFKPEKISSEQLNAARMSRVFVGNVFPNFSMLVLPMTEDPAHAPTGIITIRVWQPKGPGKVEVWNWFAGYKNMSPQLKDRVYKAGLGTFSMGGSFEMDDTEPWITISRMGKSPAADLLDFNLNYQMGMPGVGIAKRVEKGWPGPGEVFQTRYEEGVQRNMWRFYAKLMRCEPGEWPTAPSVEDDSK